MAGFEAPDPQQQGLKLHQSAAAGFQIVGFKSPIVHGGQNTFREAADQFFEQTKSLTQFSLTLIHLRVLQGRRFE